MSEAWRSLLFIQTQGQKRDCHTPFPYAQTRRSQTTGVRNDKRSVIVSEAWRSHLLAVGRVASFNPTIESRWVGFKLLLSCQNLLMPNCPTFLSVISLPAQPQNCRGIGSGDIFMLALTPPPRFPASLHLHGGFVGIDPIRGQGGGHAHALEES